MDIREDKYFTYWKELYDALENSVQASFLSRIAYDHFEKNKIIIATTSSFTSSYFEKHLDTMNQTLEDISGEKIKIELIQKTADYVEGLKNKTNYIPEEIEEKENEEIEDVVLEIGKTQEKAEQNDSEVNSFTNVFRQKQQSLKNLKTSQIRKNSNLTERYTFDSFIYGDNTSFTYNVALTIAKNPGITYNPCLIYGGVGLGKTHLLQSIGNYINTNSKRLKVIYVTAEAFTNEFIASLQQQTISSFKNKYRKVDVLLIDDIHFLQNKENTQEELFHTFNDLYETRRQMVFTCDRPITELKNITDRLLSRFRRGMNIDLKPPTYETKYAILTTKCKENNLKLDSAIIDYLCLNINTNVRDLESALMKLGAFAKFTKCPITLEKAMDLVPSLNDISQDNNRSYSVDEIIRETANYFEVSYYDLKGKKRTKKIVNPRQIAIYISREMTNFSTTEIGADFSRDHTTIMHAIEKVDKLIKTDLELKKNINKIIENIKNNK